MTRYAQIGAVIMEARRRRGLRQVDLARLVHLHPTSMAHIEQGRRCGSIPLLLLLGRVLGINLRDEWLRVQAAEWDQAAAAAKIPRHDPFARPGGSQRPLRGKE
jgi:DNA-binding XRE family transcriptional regulator